MDARDIVLAVLDVLDHATAARIHKLVFLSVVEGGVSASVSFKPYYFGPLSPEVHVAIDELVAEGLVALETCSLTEEGYTLKLYRITEKGRREAWRIAETSREELRRLRYIVSRFGRMPLSLIIAYIYYKYTEYTELSIIKEKAEKLRNKLTWHASSNINKPEALTHGYLWTGVIV